MYRRQAGFADTRGVVRLAAIVLAARAEYCVADGHWSHARTIST